MTFMNDILHKYWFRAFITEIYLTKLMTPVLLIPTEAITSYGILRSFNFPLREVAFTAAILIVMTGNSIVLVFYYRFIVMLPERNWVKVWKLSKILIIIFFSVTSVKIRGLLSSSFCTYYAYLSHYFSSIRLFPQIKSELSLNILG